MDNKYVISPTGTDIVHFGKGHDDQPPGRGSGRYAWGTGKRPRGKERKALKLEAQRAQTKEAILRSGNASAVLSIQSSLTNQELKEAADRIKLNIDIADYAAKQHVSKWQKAQKVMDRFKDVVAWSDTGIKAWNNFAKVYNSAIGEDSEKVPLPQISGGKDKKKK